MGCTTPPGQLEGGYKWWTLWQMVNICKHMGRFQDLRTASDVCYRGPRRSGLLNPEVSYSSTGICQIYSVVNLGLSLLCVRWQTRCARGQVRCTGQLPIEFRWATGGTLLRATWIYWFFLGYDGGFPKFPDEILNQSSWKMEQADQELSIECAFASQASSKAGVRRLFAWCWTSWHWVGYFECLFSLIFYHILCLHILTVGVWCFFCLSLHKSSQSNEIVRLPMPVHNRVKNPSISP